MLARTHFSIGAAMSIILTQPDSLSKLVLAAGVGGFGALISDIDIGTSDSHKEANKVIAAVVCLTGIIILCDYVFNLNIENIIMSNSNIMRVIMGGIIFLGVCAYGKDKPHRSFMHSFLAMILLGFSVGLIWVDLAPYFSIGFLSHILIDTLNHKRVKLFYPTKHKGIAFKICYADGLANKLLFWAASTAAAMESVFTIIRIYR